MSTMRFMLDVPAETRRIQNIVEHISNGRPAVRWRYSAHSNERFPLRLYATARHGDGAEAHDAVVIAVELFNPVDELGDRIIVSADIMDEDGGILSQSPRYEVPIDQQADGAAPIQQVGAALQKIVQWLDGEGTTIQSAIAQN